MKSTSPSSAKCTPTLSARSVTRCDSYESKGRVPQAMAMLPGCPESASLFIPMVDRAASGPDSLHAGHVIRMHEHPQNGRVLAVARWLTDPVERDSNT